MTWQLVITWNEGQSTSPVVDVAPNEGWRVADRFGEYVLVRDEDVVPSPGEFVVSNDAYVLVDLFVTSRGEPVVEMPLPSGMCAALALKATASFSER